jgi:K+/H+ antiporter YhaU regulatory subunit KhtT
VVGVQKGEERIINPDPKTVLAAEDILWIVGEN